MIDWESVLKAREMETYPIQEHVAAVTEAAEITDIGELTQRERPRMQAEAKLSAWN